MSHTCPAPTCRRSVPDHMLACSQHWFNLPRHLRVKINDTFNAGGAGTPELRELHAVAAEEWAEQHAAAS